MRISDWSSDVCSSDLLAFERIVPKVQVAPRSTMPAVEASATEPVPVSARVGCGIAAPGTPPRAVTAVSLFEQEMVLPAPLLSAPSVVAGGVPLPPLPTTREVAAPVPHTPQAAGAATWVRVA